MKGMTLARCFRVLDSIVLAILIYLGALAFKRVVASEKNQLAYAIQVGSPPPEHQPHSQQFFITFFHYRLCKLVTKCIAASTLGQSSKLPCPVLFLRYERERHVASLASPAQS